MGKEALSENPRGLLVTADGGGSKWLFAFRFVGKIELTEKLG